MLTNVTTIPADLTQETSLNSKYVKGIPTAVTDPDVNIGNATHTHDSDGNHGHSATVPSHSHGGTHSSGGSSNTITNQGSAASVSHTHSMSSSSAAVAEASNDGAHTHDTKSLDLEHRTITFYKKTNTSISMSRKSLPRKMTFFYSKTGTLPAGLLENLNYVDKHIKGDVTPGTEAGSNTHQHDNITHNHPADISAHEHTFSFGGAVGTSLTGSGFAPNQSNPGHGHGAGTAATTNKSSTPVTSGDSAGHQHDDISHEPPFKTLRLMEVNSVKMSNVGVPKNCVFLWLDLISLIVAGWQVSDGTNDTIDMLDILPKGNATPDITGGLDTHTHAEDTANHSHTGADVAHDHDPTGGSDSHTGTQQVNSAGGSVSGPHSHGVSTVATQAAQTVTITNAASNHDHGSKSNEPDAKTVAFIQRIT